MFHDLFLNSRVFRVISRVQRLSFIGLGAAVLLTLNACSQASDESRSEMRAITQSQAIASDFLRTELALSPETASRLDLERFLSPNANFALDNHSQAGFERRRLVRIELLQRVLNRPRLAADHPLTRDLDVAQRALYDLIALEQLGYGRFSYADYRPYAIDPYSGIWIEGPTLLAFRQSITNANQAAAYLARLRALSAAVGDTKRRLIADQASGILLPRALAEETRDRLALLLDDDVNGLNRLAETYNALTASVFDLSEDQRTHLSDLVRLEINEKLRPAYQDLLVTLDAAIDATADQAGVWAQPKGQDVFAGILTASLGGPLSTTRLHENHLETVAKRVDQASAIMTLSEDFAPTAAPKPDVLALQYEWYDAATRSATTAAAVLESEASVTDTLVMLAPKTDWQRIAAAPTLPEQTGAIQQFIASWDSPPYLTWRSEGAGARAPYRTLTEYSAIQAAWQHYVWDRRTSETEAADTPMMPVARQSISLIQSVLAAADTGIHLNRWSIAEAANFITLYSGLSQDVAEQLALDIAARPGYHTAVAAAWQRIDSLSERSEAVLGEHYSETDFQRTLIEPGPRPLAFIEQDIEAWYGARLANLGED